MKRYVLILFFVSFNLLFSEDYFIDQYEFEWKILELGNIGLSITKDEIKTEILLTSSDGFTYSTLNFSSEDILEIIDVLSKVDNIYKKFRKSDLIDLEEEYEFKNSKVVFSKSKNGFKIKIKQGSYMSYVSLSRQELLVILPYLKDIDKMLQYVEAKINLE